MALLPGTPCIVMTSGGIPVSEAPAGFGTTLTPASDGLGIGVTIVTPSATLGGMPVTFVSEAGALLPGGGGSGGAVFPTISGLNLHVSSAGLADNTAVSSYTDTSGAANHLIQATGANQPKSFTSGGTDTKPFVFFDGQNNTCFLANSGYSTNLQAATFFWVGDTMGVDGSHYLLNIGSIACVVMVDNGTLKLYDGGFNAAGRVYSGRRFAFALVLGPSGKTLYVDDIGSAFASAAFGVGTATAIALGNNGGVYNGRQYEFAAWNKACNSSEVGQLLTYAASAYGTGASQQAPTGRVVFDGDSTTFGYGGTRGRNLGYYLNINSGWYPYNFGIAGQTLTDMIGDQAEPNALANATNWLVVEGGYNDLGNGDSGATVEGRLNTYCTAAISAGFSKSKIVVMTFSTSGPPTTRDAANTLVRANYTGYAGWLIDQAANAQLGVVPGSGFLNAANFADGVHKNDTGYGLQAALIRSTIGGSLPW